MNGEAVAARLEAVEAARKAREAVRSDGAIEIRRPVRAAAGSGVEGLTVRQSQVATLIALGWDRQEVSRRLGISNKTYDSHRGTVLRVLGARSDVGVVWAMCDAGWIDRDGRWDGPWSAEPWFAAAPDVERCIGFEGRDGRR